MVGIFSSINHKKFLIVLVLSFVAMIAFQFKNEEFEIVNIYDFSDVRKDGRIQGVIDRENSRIYLSNESTFNVINDYDLSDTKSVKINFPELKEIGSVEKSI